jgi:predicted transcriptional regulator
MAKAESAREELAKLSRRERECLDALFQHGEATVAEVMRALPDPPSYSAVRATLNVLVEKGQATYRQDGPRYVYLPTVPAEKARSAAMRHLVKTFFNGNTEQAMAALLEISDTKTSRETLDKLTRKVQAARKEGR